MRDGRLALKVVVVMGAGQSPGETIGNGRAIATLFAREGARVLCVDRLPDRAEETAQAIRDEGGDAGAFAADVVRRSECDAAIAESAARWGGIDILVNNVGIGGGGDGPAHKLSEAAFDRILAVNLKGMWNGVAAAIPVLRDRGGGAIVNISSLAGIAGHNQLAYEVSKAAVNRLTTSVAGSNARHGVRCNAVAPGLIDTPMAIAGIAAARGIDPAIVRAERNRQVPMGAMGWAEDVALAALFLASDESRFVTGAILPVDGGMGVRIG